MKNAQECGGLEFVAVHRLGGHGRKIAIIRAVETVKLRLVGVVEGRGMRSEWRGPKKRKPGRRKWSPGKVRELEPRSIPSAHTSAPSHMSKHDFLVHQVVVASRRRQGGSGSRVMSSCRAF